MWMFTGVYRCLQVFTVALVLVGCGSSGSSGGGGSTGDSKRFLMVLEELPECNQGSEGQTVYLESEERFEYCDGLGWTPIDLAGPAGADGTDGADGAAGADGLKIKYMYSYNTTDIMNEVDVAPAAALGTFEIYISTIKVTKFEDSSTFLSVVGLYVTTDTGSDIYTENFTHSFLVDLTHTYASDLNADVNAYLGATVYYKVGYYIGTPVDGITVKIAVNPVGGTSNDDAFTSYILTKD